MAIVLDELTKAEYDAQSIASARSALVVSALTAPVVVEVFDGLNVRQALGTMLAPWATYNNATITIGEVNSTGLIVSGTGTPDANWYCQFRGANGRFVRGTFGVAGSGRDLVWSLTTFEAGSKGAIGTAILTTTGAVAGNAEPIWSTVPTIDIVQGTSASVTSFATDPDNGPQPLVYTLESGGLPAGVTFANGVFTASGSATTGLSALLVVGANDGFVAGSSPANTALPVITGTPQVGQTLSCSTGTWTGTATIAYTYQWLRAGSTISGATNATYLCAVADVGAALSCRVTATNGIGSASATSASTSQVLGTSSSYDADFAARGTVGVNGVFYSTNASDTAATQAQFFRNASTPAGRVNLQSAIKRSGTQAVRIDVPDNGGADNGAWVIPIAGGRGPGTTTYYQATIYTDEAMIRYYPLHQDSGGGAYDGGWKCVHLGGSRTTGSNQLFEVVIQNTNYRGYPQGYSRNSSGNFPPFDVGVSSPQNNSNLRHHNAVDNGTPTSFGGLDSEFVKRYGPLYTIGGKQSTPARGDIFAQGLPHPSVALGSVVWVANGWTTIEVMVEFGAYNQPASRIKVWAARAGSPEKLIIDMQNWELGSDPAEPLGHTALWLHNYETNKVPNTRGRDTFQVYTEAIMSTQWIPFPTVA